MAKNEEGPAKKRWGKTGEATWARPIGQEKGDHTRMISCPQPHFQFETRPTQFRTERGFRDLRCGECGNRIRCGEAECHCEEVWHRRPAQRTDPLGHTSRKAQKRVRERLPASRNKYYLRTTPICTNRHECERNAGQILKVSSTTASRHPATSPNRTKASWDSSGLRIPEVTQVMIKKESNQTGLTQV